VICEVYLLVNLSGTKTRQWVLVAAGRAFPEVFTRLGLAKAVAWCISKETTMQADLSERDRGKVLERVKAKILKEIEGTISVERGRCPQGRMSLGAFDLGFEACLKCPHLRVGEARPGPAGKPSVRDGLWECGAILQQVIVARRLADR